MHLGEYNIPIWPGSSSFQSGSTPFGFYDADPHFVNEVDRFADWCAKRLGYPISDIELQDVNFYAAFEEAITEYSSLVNMNNIKDNMLHLTGAPTGSSLNGKLVSTSLNKLILMSEDYGTEAGTGGNVTYLTGSIEVKAGVQTYDLNTLWTLAGGKEEGERIEIKKVLHQAPPAIVRYFDPFLDTALGSQTIMESFGFGAFSPAVTYLMMPMYADLLRLQAIEFNDQIRKSSFGFEVTNNQIRIHPRPTKDFKVWIHYIRKSDRANPTKNLLGTKYSNGIVTDLSNVPYDNIQYSAINSVGKRWIYQYATCIAKEMLGWIRSKYSSIPIPNSEIQLNGNELISSAQTEKDTLREKLKLDLDELSRTRQIEKQKDEANFMQEQLMKIPLKIYVG